MKLQLPASPKRCLTSKTIVCVRPWPVWALRSSEIDPSRRLGRWARHCHNCAVQLAKTPNLTGKAQEIPLQITRREFCRTTATLALATGLLGFSSLSPFPVEAFAETDRKSVV